MQRIPPPLSSLSIDRTLPKETLNLILYSRHPYVTRLHLHHVWLPKPPGTLLEREIQTDMNMKDRALSPFSHAINGEKPTTATFTGEPPSAMVLFWFMSSCALGDESQWRVTWLKQVRKMSSGGEPPSVAVVAGVLKGAAYDWGFLVKVTTMRLLLVRYCFFSFLHSICMHRRRRQGLLPPATAFPASTNQHIGYHLFLVHVYTDYRMGTLKL